MWLKSTTCLYALRTKTCIEKNSNEVQLLVLARSWFPGSVLARTQNVEPVVWVMILQKVELVIWTLGSRNCDINQPQNQLASCHLVFHLDQFYRDFLELHAYCPVDHTPFVPQQVHVDYHFRSLWGYASCKVKTQMTHSPGSSGVFNSSLCYQGALKNPHAHCGYHEKLSVMEHAEYRSLCVFHCPFGILKIWGLMYKGWQGTCILDLRGGASMTASMRICQFYIALKSLSI